MCEHKEKMKGLIYKLDKKGKARMYKLEKMKTTFHGKYETSCQNSKFKLDFSSYKSIEQARTEIFKSVFTVSKKTSNTVHTNVYTN